MRINPDFQSLCGGRLAGVRRREFLCFSKENTLLESKTVPSGTESFVPVDDRFSGRAEEPALRGIATGAAGTGVQQNGGYSR